MLENRRIAVVVPAHDEARQIARVLETMPSYVDDVIVVDDDSRDGTDDAARRAIPPAHTSVLVLRHDRRRGPGAAIATGYRAALERGAQIVAVMAGDGQMDPADLRDVLEPVLRGQADYSKGDRLGRALRRPKGMPLARWLGTEALTIATRVASGYGTLRDAQSGFTAASAECLASIPIARLYPGYGYPNHLLILMGRARQRVVDVPVRAVYGVGERSELRPWRVAPALAWMLAVGAARRAGDAAAELLGSLLRVPRYEERVSDVPTGRRSRAQDVAVEADMSFF